MIRWLQAFSVMAAAGAAVFVFQVKYRAEAVAEQAVQLQRELDQENEAKSLLAAEWSLLIQPARVQELVQRHEDLLKLQPLDPVQIIRIENLPMRPTGPAPDDAEALSAILETPTEESEGGRAMTAIIPASVWRHQRAAEVKPAGDPERRGRSRVMLAMLGFFVLYGVLAGRLVLLGIGAHGDEEDRGSFIRSASQARPDIIDRNGETLATDIRTAALFAEPRYVIDPDEATELLVICPSGSRPRSAEAASLH